MDVGKIIAGKDILRLNNNATDGVFVLKKAEQAQAQSSALSRLTGSVLGYNEYIRFRYNEETNSMVMKVVDSATNEVIREIPSKNAMKVLQYMQEYAGLFIDESR